MKKCINSIQNLIDANLIDLDKAQKLAPVVSQYKLAISAEMVGAIKKNDNSDPIYKQFVPDIHELDVSSREIFDPIGDEKHSPLNGLVHRYSDRVLLKLTNNCPIYCRFCFRRETVGKPQAGILDDNELGAIMAYLQNHSEIKEVILTGGDPLMLAPKYLLKVASILKSIKSIQKLRVHSRVICAVPKLISQNLIDALKFSEKPIRIAAHINHSNEITETSLEKIKMLLANDIELISQTVLLAGVNDNALTLSRLYNDFANLGIKPYYLHHPDLARGTGHFQMDFGAGLAIFAKLSDDLPPNLLPRYVIDIPNGYGKVDVNFENIKTMDVGKYLIKDRFGAWHTYAN